MQHRRKKTNLPPAISNHGRLAAYTANGAQRRDFQTPFRFRFSLWTKQTVGREASAGRPQIPADVPMLLQAFGVQLNGVLDAHGIVIV